MVIRGWDEGIALMKTGEKGTLIIPSALGYGAAGAGANIPPNSVLIFDVELLEVK
jgi:FKBP-type peptidyl-prolyl cis-trans isomerases 1